MPITPNLLLRNGFEYSKGSTIFGLLRITDSYELKHNGAIIYLDDNGKDDETRWQLHVSGARYDVKGNIGYADELKDVFDFCGIDKKIELI